MAWGCLARAMTPVGCLVWLQLLACLRTVGGEAEAPSIPALPASAVTLQSVPGGLGNTSRASGSSADGGLGERRPAEDAAHLPAPAGASPLPPSAAAAASLSLRGHGSNASVTAITAAAKGKSGGGDDTLTMIETIFVVIVALYCILYLVVMLKTKSGSKQRRLANYFLCCWQDLYAGHAFWLWNVLFSPVLLVYHAFRIYVGSCLYIYIVERCFFLTCFWATSYFEDHEFGPGPQTLGNIGGDTANEASGKNESEVTWVRAAEFSREGLGERPPHPQLHDTDMELFHGKIEPNDIQQGGLGNCWLMAALAALSEHEGAVESIFLTKEVNPRGKYKVRLFDPQEEKWKHIVVDEFVPCMYSKYAADKIWRDEKTQMPKTMFATPHGKEIWVMIIEKAFAKLCGSYAALEGGFTEWGVMCMTGQPAWRYELNGDKFMRNDIVPMVDPNNPHDKRAVGFGPRPEESYDVDEFFKVIRYHHQNGAVLCCGGVKKGSTAKDMGLISGHAFSLLQVEEVRQSMTSVTKFRMVQIRNPWGTGEWTGDWSDKSPKWEEYPNVAQTLGHVIGGKDDGAFWMEWHDFCNFWGYVGVVDCTTDINTLHFPQYDEKEREGPLKAFAQGCFQYWCMCKGPFRFFVNHKATRNQLTPEDFETTCGVDVSGHVYCNICSRYART